MSVKREQHANRRGREALLPLAQVRANRPALDWSAYTPPKTEFSRHSRFRRLPAAGIGGANRLDAVFRWELRGRYPAILDDPEQGEHAATCSPTLRPCWTRFSRNTG